MSGAKGIGQLPVISKGTDAYLVLEFTLWTFFFLEGKERTNTIGCIVMRLFGFIFFCPVSFYRKT